MRINNLVRKVKHCNNFFLRAKGLMFSKKEDKALLFRFPSERKVGLHMFFVFYPIDVVFLSAGKRVVEIKENFKPFTIYNPRMPAKYVIELPALKVKEFNIKINDKIEF